MYRQVEESQTLLINSQSKVLVASDQEVIKFGFGQSPFLPPGFVMQALRENAHRKDYTSVQGELGLREAISNFHFRHNNLSSDPEDILVAPGSKILLYNILLSFTNADVFIPSPAWVSYAPQVKLIGHHAIRIATNYEERWRINSHHLEAAIGKKKCQQSILILNYPGNPNGLTYTMDELCDIAETARKHNIWILSDEIYGLLDHNSSHISMATVYPEKTFTTTGLSKWCGAGGWRFGAVLLPSGVDPELKKALIGIGSETYSCAPTPVQLAAYEAYSNYDDSMSFVNQQNRVLSIIGNYCAQKLNKAEVRTHAPQGGFYLFPDFSLYTDKLKAKHIRTSSELCSRLLLEAGVALLPASAFGFNQEYLAARLAYVDIDDILSNETIDMDRDCPNIVKGIDLLLDWLNA